MENITNTTKKPSIVKVSAKRNEKGWVWSEVAKGERGLVF